MEARGDEIIRESLIIIHRDRLENIFHYYARARVLRSFCKFNFRLRNKLNVADRKAEECLKNETSIYKSLFIYLFIFEPRLFQE